MIFLFRRRVLRSRTLLLISIALFELGCDQQSPLPPPAHIEGLRVRPQPTDRTVDPTTKPPVVELPPRNPKGQPIPAKIVEPPNRDRAGLP